jgi:DNA-binding transcriptional regulator YiaG
MLSTDEMRPELLKSRRMGGWHTMPAMKATPAQMDHKRQVGQRLALARTALGLTLSKLKTDYGYSESRISNWESGLHYPDPWLLIHLCNDYGLTMDWFYRGVLAGVSAERAGDLRQAGAGKQAA